MFRVSCLLASCVVVTLFLATPLSAYPSPSYYYRDDNPMEAEEFVNLMNNLNDIIQLRDKVDDYKNAMPSAKRALDLGLSRGYSGAMQAKHLMGIAAANYAGGPGRRRRDVSY